MVNKKIILEVLLIVTLAFTGCSKVISNQQVGVFILFGENVKNSNQLLELVNSLKSTNSIE